MRNRSPAALFLLSGGVLLAAALAGAVLGRGGAAGLAARPVASGTRVLQAAQDLLASLDEKERKTAVLEFADAERFNWHFIPRERKGIPLKDLPEGKRAKVIALVRAGLSPRGAELVEKVMAHEAILAAIEGSARRFPRDPLLYHLTFFSPPSAEGRWGWRLEGHHLTVNFTLDGERVLSATPLVYGANPSVVREGPQKGLRLLPGVEDRARELVASLAEAELAACRGEEGGAVPEEVPGTQAAGYKGPYPRGVSGEKLSGEQRRKLRELIAEYTANLPEDLAVAIAEEGWKEVHFAWRGGLKPFEPHSYLVHGPGFLINYSNVQNGAAHVHSCFRKLKGEFGLAPEGKAGG